MKLDNSFETDTVAGTKLTGGITDKRGYGERWGFSLRHIDNLLAQGMPHLKIGSRRVRILIDEADAWMRQRFGTQRRAPASRTTAALSQENTQ
jgi:hypothetical protein